LRKEQELQAIGPGKIDLPIKDYSLRDSQGQIREMVSHMEAGYLITQTELAPGYIVRQKIL
jgi:hypothetical protein